ncbi:JmjC domain-containing protein [Plantactinospora sp. CA-294935]|uniref:JmjC domain-containing protein n=1 Tax=Plantactinospora sp. CA-294935 TaxID=3240012 RepID=UPI003D917B16
MPDLAVVDGDLNWDTFVSSYWDCRPVLYRGVSNPPFDETATFRTAVRAAEPSRNGPALTPNAQFTVERLQRVEAGDQLPVDDDGSFDGYQERLAVLLGGRRYALVMNCFHAFDYGLWSRQRSFFAPLWQRVGLPYVSAITTMFHGTYEHSPVGVHRDRYGTFMLGLRGRKRMRFWADRPWSAPVTTVLDYDGYRPESFAVEVGPGDLLYWPASYYHVGESAGAEPATSVNVGIPREASGVLAAPELFADVDPVRIGDSTAGLDQLEPVPAAPYAPGPGPDGRLPDALPASLRQATAALRDLAHGGGLRDRTTALSLRFWTAGGFRPVPAPAPPRRLDDSTPVQVAPQVPLLWSPAGTGTMLAANGHVLHTAVRPAGVRRLLASLAGGRVVRVGVLLDDLVRGAGSGRARPEAARPDRPAPLPATREGVRELLALLVGCHGLVPVPDSGGAEAPVPDGTAPGDR